MDQDLLAIILKGTYTQTQLKHRVRILKSYIQDVLFAAVSEKLNQPDLDWLRSLPADFYQKFNKDNSMGVFAKLEEDLAKLAVLTIHLPFDADETVQIQLGSFARKTFGQETLLLDIKYDPSLIAGCALSWKGVYRDYSVKSKIAEKRAEILQSIGKYLK